MSARVDPSEYSVVVWCTLCPSYSAVVLDEKAGHDLAVDHEFAVHPGVRTAFVNRFKWTRRQSLSKVG